MMAGSMVVAAKQEHQCVAGANNIKQPAWRWSTHNNNREVIFLLAFNKVRNHEAVRLCTRRSGRSL